MNRNIYKKLAWALTLALASFGMVACQTDTDVDTPKPYNKCLGGKCDDMSPGNFVHKWAIDMQKVRDPDVVYRYSGNARFVAATQAELQLPDDLWQAQCRPERVVTLDDEYNVVTVEDGECFSWGNMQTKNWDHTPHVDDPENNPIINIIDDGNLIDPPGYLNIIAMKNTERHQQDEITGYLQNGDILVYFHPEDDDTTQFRMHHAAMYYNTGEGPLAIKLGDVPYVHHIDNPVSYGPSFVGGAESVPFHVYRFKPNGSVEAENRDAEGKFMFPCTPESGLCAEGDEFFTITDEQAKQYAYAARNWALLTNGHAPFASFQDLSWNDAHQRAQAGRSVLEEVDRYAGPALRRGRIPEVYCAGLVYTNLNLGLNRPMNQSSLTDDLLGIFAGIEAEFDDGYMVIDGSPHELLTADDLAVADDLLPMGQLVFEPIMGSDMIDAWMKGYYGNLPEQVRGGLIMQSADRLRSGFAYQWDWQAYGGAYTQGEQARQAMKEQEKLVARRYVPPPVYHYEANDMASPIAYVGTVIPVDLLSPLPGFDGDTGGGGVSEFTEGGPDTSLYTHYYIEDGGRHAQRLINVNAGPELIGAGSKISTRITCSDIRDIRVVLHPPGTFEPDASVDPGDVVYMCDRNADCIGDAPGIPVSLPVEDYIVDPEGVNPLQDVKFEFELFKPVDQGGLGCTYDEDGDRTCPGYSWATGDPWPVRRLTLGKAHGFWTMSIIDLGDHSQGVAIENCEKCETGGAHSNQWILTVRDDEYEPPEDPDALVFRYEGAPVHIPDTFDDRADCGDPELEERGQADIVVDSPALIATAKVRFQLQHTYPEDLYAELLKDGEQVQELVLCDASFDEVNEDVLEKTVTLEGVEDSPLAGTWTLRVGDYWGGDDGDILSFSLVVSPQQ